MIAPAPEQRKAMSEQRRFVTFIATGATSAVFNLATRAACSTVMPYEAAIAVAYVVGMTIAFLLARRFVFDVGATSTHGQYGRFALVNVMSFLVTLGVSVGLARGLFPAIGMTWRSEDIAHFIGVGSPAVLSYYAHKHFSFGERKARA
jgi:putative flippase GtrA